MFNRLLRRVHLFFFGFFFGPNQEMTAWPEIARELSNSSKAGGFSTLPLDCQSVNLYEYESGFSSEVV